MTCTDERSKDNNGNRDKNRLILKFGEIDRNGALSFREVENTIGEYELIELFKPESISEVSVAYNVNGKGKLSKIIPGLSNYEQTCHLQKMNPVEINLGREPLSPVNPSINSVSLMNDDIFICLKNKFKTPYWNLKENGLNSKRSLKPVWPVYMLSAYGIDNNQEKICYCENDPYTPFDDNQCQPENIVDIFPFNNGNVGIVEKKGANCFFHVFDSQLKRAHPPIQLASNVVPSSIQHFEVRNEKLFLYYNSFDNNKNTFRALVYNWKTGKTEWEKSKILWEDVENREREYKLVPYDNHRFVAVSFSPNSGTYSHQATMEYRVLNVN